eukprot:2455944-Pyramimonas_sp.AAC.1
MEQMYQAKLDQHRAAARVDRPAQQRVSKAFNDMRTLEGKLCKAATHSEKLQADFLAQKFTVQRLPVELSEGEGRHKSLAMELHQS